MKVRRTSQIPIQISTWEKGPYESGLIFNRYIRSKIDVRPRIHIGLNMKVRRTSQIPTRSPSKFLHGKKDLLNRDLFSTSLITKNAHPTEVTNVTGSTEKERKWKHVLLHVKRKCTPLILRRVKRILESQRKIQRVLNLYPFVFFVSQPGSVCNYNLFPF